MCQTLSRRNKMEATKAVWVRDYTRLVFHAAKRKETVYMKKFVKLLDVPGTKQWADMIKREVEAFYQPSRDPDQTGACSPVKLPT